MKNIIKSKNSISSKKSVLASAILLTLNLGALYSSSVQAVDMCGTKTLDRQGEVLANQTHCITDYGHYLYVNVPYENSDVTITTSNGTFNGSDADIFLYEGDSWSGNVELSSAIRGTNNESISFVSRAGSRYFRINGNIQETTLQVTVTGGIIPPPMGDYIVFDTHIVVDIPAPSITSKSQYASVIASILAASYSDFEGIASALEDPIDHVSDAIHHLASTDDLTDPDLNQLLYFLGSYKYYAPAISDAEAAKLSIALQAVASMTGFLSTDGGVIQEGYAKALNNFERDAGATYFKDQLPHLLATIQYHSTQTTPFGAGNAGNATMALLGALDSAAVYGDASVKSAYNNNMLDILSVMRSFAFLGETSLDMQWPNEADRKWILPHTFIAMGKISSIATDEAKARFDSTVLEVHGKVTQVISVETTEGIVTKNYLKSAGRQCEASDPLFGICLVPPKEEDILTVRHQCTDKVVIRAQSSISQETLAQSCADIALQETEFHNFFNTGGVPVTDDQNDVIEVVAFASPEDYEKYAPEFFGISTNNGGMYLEGTPKNVGNQARFIAMQCPDSWVGTSCQYIDQIYNLRHEFVHYLDGRYIKAGSYGSFDYNVSWSEGMAEYMANGAEHTRTLNALKGETIPPLYNVLFMSYEYDDLYQWGYFAMRYLGEQHPDEVASIAAALQAGDNAAYIAVLKGVAERTEAGFEAFVLANSETLAPATAAIPAADTIGSCALAQQYVRKVDANKTEYTITNTTDTPVSLFWVDNNKGTANFAKNYKTLNRGESYTAASWSEGDRLMLTDNAMNCLGVAMMEPVQNNFTIDADLVKDVVPEAIPEQDMLGSCELARPHLIKDQSHAFTITNTTDYPIRLFRVDSLTGKPKYASAATGFGFGYGTLNKGESYTSDIWFGDRRIMLTDARLNCLSVGVLNNATADFIIDAATIANVAAPEVIPAANTIGSCDLMNKHLTGPFEADFSFTNNSSTPVRVYRVDNETGELSDSFGFTTLANGETYDSATTWKWFGHRRAAITNTSGQCLGVAVMTEEGVSNDYEITEELVGGGSTPVDTDGDGVIDSQDAFPNDATESVDTDGDGVGDNLDAFPNDATETLDSDGDGVGDNLDAFPNDATETLDSDGDGVGDNADVYPHDPNNGVVQSCGVATITSGQLTLENEECISGGKGSFYVYVDTDNTDLYITTQGGEGDANIYFNADTWASSTNAQSKSELSGNSESLHVVANRGWRYIAIDTGTRYSGVTVKVSLIDSGSTPVEPPVEPELPSALADTCATESVQDYGSIGDGVPICVKNGRSYFYINVPAGTQSLTAETGHGVGELELYVGENWPDASSNTGASANPGTIESVTVNQPKSGWYYVSVQSMPSSEDVTLKVTLK
ncbi:collagenase [Shewanella benthica]|uniref:Collagenase family protein n=1 Tax=Shewanella benthica KT99 TaxID=314608 RepID=A9DF22_9GAMM|nr:collagenase [Shewanella benthica]EDP99964.1 Collagenase family protein [Shewanella benthica KT99]